MKGFYFEYKLMIRIFFFWIGWSLGRRRRRRRIGQTRVPHNREGLIFVKRHAEEDRSRPPPPPFNPIAFTQTVEYQGIFIAADDWIRRREKHKRALLYLFICLEEFVF